MGNITRRVFMRFLSALGLTGLFGGIVSCGSSSSSNSSDRSDNGIPSSFSIANGDADPLVSDSIWCKTLPDVPLGWLETDTLPPGAYENPVYRDEGWVWIRAGKKEELGTDQTATLNLFVGMKGRAYTVAQLVKPTNWFAPDVTWTSAQWESELTAGKVVPVPWFNGATTEANCDIALPANQPGPGLSRWYLFKWERDLVMPPSFCTSSAVSLIACVDDSKSTQSGLSITSNPASAQRNGSII